MTAARKPSAGPAGARPAGARPAGARPAGARPAGPAPGEPGSTENPLSLTDPRAMRALAHPARIAILQHLGLDGPATATECAEVAGLSPSACSYHLRALARYGFVAADPASAADGRHRPWRARVVGLEFRSKPGQSIAYRSAGRLLQESMLARVDELRAQYYDRETQYPQAWRSAAGLLQDVLHVTAEELTEIREQLGAVVASYRRLDPAERPPDARRVHAILDFTPWFAPDGDS